MNDLRIKTERYILGSCIIESKAIYQVTIIKPEMFCIESHEIIFRSLLELCQNNIPIDSISVSRQSIKNGFKDNITYFVDLTSGVGSASHLEYHSAILVEYWMRDNFEKQLIDINDKLQSKNFISIGMFIDECINNLSNIFNNIERSKAFHISKSIQEIEKRVNDLSTGKEIDIIKTNIRNLDNYFQGFERSDLIIIAARPSMGKTAFVLTIARKAAINGLPIAIFSLEMSSKQLTNRIISCISGLSTNSFTKRKLNAYEYDSFQRSVKIVNELPIYIDDTPGINFVQLKSKCIRLKHKYGIELIIVDFIQLMSGIEKKQNREAEISTISRNLKCIAKELNIPVIALSQLNRSVEIRGGDKRPRLSDLRESGAIEQDADIIMFLYRPEYYGLKKFEDDTSTEGICEIIVAKYRNGEIGSFNMKFDKKTTDFDSIDKDIMETQRPRETEGLPF